MLAEISPHGIDSTRDVVACQETWTSGESVSAGSREESAHVKARLKRLCEAVKEQPVTGREKVRMSPKEERALPVGSPMAVANWLSCRTTANQFALEKMSPSAVPLWLYLSRTQIAREHPASPIVEACSQAPKFRFGLP
ncbi:MAG: hypothetical protein ACI8PQ_001806 [Planctomycetota bacterium]